MNENVKGWGEKNVEGKILWNGEHVSYDIETLAVESSETEQGAKGGGGTSISWVGKFRKRIYGEGDWVTLAFGLVTTERVVPTHSSETFIRRCSNILKKIKERMRFSLIFQMRCSSAVRSCDCQCKACNRQSFLGSTQ